MCSEDPLDDGVSDLVVHRPVVGAADEELVLGGQDGAWVICARSLTRRGWRKLSGGVAAFVLDDGGVQIKYARSQFTNVSNQLKIRGGGKKIISQ